MTTDHEYAERLLHQVARDIGSALSTLDEVKNMRHPHGFAIRKLAVAYTQLEIALYCLQAAKDSAQPVET